MTEISIGDVLMLSQVAWRTARAFHSGRKDAPEEFHEVEWQLNRLAKSLKLLAETLFCEDAEIIIEQVSQNTQDGIQGVILFCEHTLEYLESLVDQYQHAPRREPESRQVVQRTWSPLVRKNFNFIMWTTEGGSIRDLRTLLHMHTATTTLIRQALDSKAVDRTEWIIGPIYKQIQYMQLHSVKDVNDSVYEMEKAVESRLKQSPVKIPALDDRTSSSTSEVPPFNLNRPHTPTGANFEFHKSRPLPHLKTSSRPGSSESDDPYSPGSNSGMPSSDLTSLPPGDRAATLGQLMSAFSRRSTMWKPPERRTGRGMSIPTPPPTPETEIDPGQIRAEPETNSRRLPPFALDGISVSKDTDISSHMLSTNSEHDIRHPSKDAASPSYNSSAKAEFATLQTAEDIEMQSQTRHARPESSSRPRSTSTASKQQTFEKILFKNSAIYCDLRGKMVEYVAPSEDETKPFDRPLRVAMEDCRICVVRRRECTENGRSEFTTSIWAFSDDLSVRFQQKLPDNENIVAYPSFFQSEKLSISMPTDVAFHGATTNAQLEPFEVVSTSWVNYIFDDVSSATKFQNTLFPAATLLSTFRTAKTTRILDKTPLSLSRQQEQMCAMEILRVWRVDDTGSIFVMIHFSAQFRCRKGYFCFFLNESQAPVGIKDCGGKTVGVKGLRVPATDDGEDNNGFGALFGNCGRSGRDSEHYPPGSRAKKLITAARIEFCSEGEKEEFLVCVREIQSHLYRYLSR